jgi:hypothetical protein
MLALSHSCARLPDIKAEDFPRIQSVIITKEADKGKPHNWNAGSRISKYGDPSLCPSHFRNRENYLFHFKQLRNRLADSEQQNTHASYTNVMFLNLTSQVQVF